MTQPVLSGVAIDLTHAGLSYRGHDVPALRRAGVPEPVILAAVKDLLQAGIDADAEALRARLASPGAGQAMEYQEAAAQAAAALTAPGSATADAYPMLAATVGIDIDPETGAPAVDVLGVARAVAAASARWLTAGAAIRKARLTGKAAVAAAATPEAAQAARVEIIWPTF
ncbi:hypothetical protein [Methylobacterium nodulans]|uniref:Uncharacterized protein n=1 Tax=Methylobacterium nodulans (strain LMG 21967 / CNCM I-2342 / ORS 2060) TaxID=460265 RepID=B8IDP5_METNO|nr:hypothetical protein [Methylobacterium nodulans]ACL55617.1 conserved hypothetical protein [Methylobacterium nodulans ORS 2060]